MGAALAGASAPELAHLLKSTEGNSAVNVIAHAILGGAVAAMQGNSAAAAAGAQAGKNAIENNALGDKDKLPVNIFDINPLKPNVLDTDGEPLKGGGGIGKFTINKGQQNKHLPGTNEYKIASEAGLNKSVLTLAPDSLLPKLGTGQQVGNTPVGVPGSKERINYGQNIGNYIDPQTGVSTPTTNGIVHYGKNGVHIVPARPSE
ncbi:polymorphic toxin type 50 domain-containing protein [Citrobacter youngae]|uniref:polymorphic toxin type 50 domain-containing protein n=1 Tax=Citrobacter youngae TaxID=133448 RepID=UPI00139D6D6E|nr:polymorphic toxin type 50 domain-containing protein [Citrobacter youngae]